MKGSYVCKLNVSMTKKAARALSVKANGKGKLVIKVKKSAKKGKTYQIKVYAAKKGAYSKSNTCTIKIKVK